MRRDTITGEMRSGSRGGRPAGVASSRRAVIGLAAAAVAGRAAQAQAGWTPPRPLRLVVPSVPGSTPDLLCRLVAEGMRRALAPVVIENRPGGLGTLGLSEVARAPPDGHTLGYVNVVSMAINDAMGLQQPYVVARDFAPVALLGFVQNAIMVHRRMPAETLPELVALLRDAPDRYTYGSPGIATTGHLAVELLRAMTATALVHVPYRGSPQLVEALRRGEVDIACDNLPSLAPLLHGGDARGLAVTGARRAPLVPDLPTVEEAGWPGFRITSWGGLVVPAQAAPEAVAQLNAAANAALAMADLGARFAALGFEVSPGPPQALSDLAARERPLWAELIRRSGARMD